MLGKEIDVYMSSIGQYVTEYLVNFDFVVHIMKQHGFELYDIKSSGIINKSLGDFSDVISSIDTIIANENSTMQKLYRRAWQSKK